MAQRPPATTRQHQHQHQQEDGGDDDEEEQRNEAEGAQDDDETEQDDGERCRHCAGSGRASDALEGLSSKPASSIYDPESMRYLSLDYASDVVRRWTWSKQHHQPYPALPEPCCSSETCDHRRGGGSSSLGKAAVIHHDSASFERCLGYPSDSVEGTWQWWEDRIHTDDRQRVCLSLERFFENPTARFWSESYRFRIHRQHSSTPSTPTPRHNRVSQFHYGKWQPSSPHEQTPSSSSPALSEVSEYTVTGAVTGSSTTPAASTSSTATSGAGAGPRIRPKPTRRFQSSSTSTRTDDSSNSSQHTHHFREDTAPEDFLTVLDQLHITRDPETGHPMSALGAMFSPEQRMKIAEALNAPRVRLLRSVPKGGISFIGSETIHTILDNTASGLFMMDAKGHPTFMNTAASVITGYASIDEIKHAPLHYAVHYKRPDGSHYPMEECPIDNSNAQIVHVQNQTEVFVRKDGTLFPVVWSATPIERMGNTIGCVIEFRDVTEERNMEQDRIKATLQAKHQDIRIKEAILHKQKMTQFVDYIAHELRNPLHGIAANVDFLRDSLGLLQQSISRTITELDSREPDPIQETSSPRQARQLSLTSTNRPRSPAMRSSEALSSAVSGVPIGVSHAVMRDQSHLGNTSKSYQQKSHTSSSMPEKEPSTWQHTGTGPSSDEKMNILRNSPAAIAMSPLLADIASSTATSNALMKSHDQVMHEQHYSPGLPTPARTTSPSAASTQMSSSSTLESQNILSSAQSFITSIRECVSHATHITNNVLDLSRFEAGKVELLDDVIHPVRVAGLAIDMMSARAQEKDISLALNSPKEDIVVRGDGTRLAQVFLNLLSNAIKFTPANGTVTLSFTMALEANRWLLSGYVTDTGVGMSAQEMKNLFQRFGQSSRSIQAEYGGTGLGLSICQEIVQLQGGKMDVTSEKGKGSTFSFTAYYNKATDKEAQDNATESGGASRRDSTSETSSVSGESLSGLTATALYKVLPAVATIAGEPGRVDASLSALSDTQKEQFEAVKRQVEETAQQRQPFTFKHILVAEDNSINQNIMKTYLRKLGYGFTIVANGQEVVDFYLKTVNSDGRIDLVLMDCEMPILDGRQATASIRQFEMHVKDFVTPLSSPASLHSSASTINALTTPGSPANDHYFSPGASSPVLAPRRRVPIVGLSGNARKELVDQAFASGMDDYIVKPFKLQELERVIKKWEKKIDEELARQSVITTVKKAIREKLDPSLTAIPEAEASTSEIPERPPLSRQAAGHLTEDHMAQGYSSSYGDSAQSSTSTIPSLSSYASRSSAPSQSPSLPSDGDIRSPYPPISEK